MIQKSIKQKTKNKRSVPLRLQLQVRFTLLVHKRNKQLGVDDTFLQTQVRLQRRHKQVRQKLKLVGARIQDAELTPPTWLREHFAAYTGVIGQHAVEHMGQGAQRFVAQVIHHRFDRAGGIERPHTRGLGELERSADLHSMISDKLMQFLELRALHGI